MKVCKGVSDLAQEVNVEDFLIIMSYFQPMDTRVGEEQARVYTHTKKNLNFLFHVYDSGNNTGRLSKCDWGASLQNPSHWEIFYSLQCRGGHDGSARICRWARLCMWQTEPDKVLEGITVNNSLNSGCWQTARPTCMSASLAWKPLPFAMGQHPWVTWSSQHPFATVIVRSVVDMFLLYSILVMRGD